MKQEFTTSTGKLIVDGDVLRIKHLKERNNYEYYRYLIWLILGVVMIYDRETIAPLAYLIVAACGLVLLWYIADYFYSNKWKNRFSTRRIKSVLTQPDTVGLETKVVLYFRSGTKKEIVFRTSEHQYEGFVALIEQHLTRLHFA